MNRALLESAFRLLAQKLDETMKCFAMRNTSESPHDRNDILKLAEMAGIADAEAVLDLVQRFYPLGRLAPRVEFGVRELLDRAAQEEEMEVENDADVPGI